MSLAHAVDYALAPSEPAPPTAAIGASPERSASTSPLTRREVEVAALVARGLTNRQIADELVVSERTVDAHVGNILGKLGFSSRARIAAWAVERGLAAAEHVRDGA